MYVSVSRWSSTGTWNNDGFQKAKDELWSKQPGFDSMAMYDIVEGEHKGQRMTVIRFKDKATFDIAYGAVKPELEELRADLEKNGTKREDLMRLEQVA